MRDSTALPRLLEQLRVGDDEAAEELVRTYGPSIRVAIRTRLTDPRLRRHFDSEDANCLTLSAQGFPPTNDILPICGRTD